MNSDITVGADLRVSCSREDLAHKLGVVARAVSTRSSVQILSGIHLRGSGDRLELSATDMELSLRTGVEAQVDGEGAVVVPGRLVVELARLLPADEVTLELRPEESVLNVTSGSSEYRLRTYSVEDFPRLPDPQTATLSTVEAEPLLETIARVGRAASRDESRPVLTGILVRFEEGKLVMAATDSYRLAVKETALDGDLPEMEVIIPARALEELRRVAGVSEQVELGMLDNHAVFGAGDVWLTTRRIDGQFPNYRQLLPETFEHEVRLRKDEVLDVVRRTAVMAQRNSPLRLRFDEGELTISAQTQDVGESKETLPVPFSGESFEIGFNAEFLRDGIESVATDELVLKLINPLRPGLIVGADEDFWYLIMPIRLAGS
jgi:DNA polymerase III subunit beta